MKIVACFLLLFSQAVVASALGDKPVPNLQVMSIHSKGIVNVRIGNPSRDPLRLWKNSNSWGASHWRILLIRKKQLITLSQKAQNFSLNAPEYLELAPQASYKQSLDVNDGTWTSSSSQPIRFVSGDEVIVVYDVPFAQESLSDSVWYGVASAFREVQ